MALSFRVYFNDKNLTIQCMCFYCDVQVHGNPKFWWWKKFVCWKCRKVADLKHDTKYPFVTRICSRCNQHMVEVGFKFKVPKKHDIKKWKELEKTWDPQIVYDTNTNDYIQLVPSSGRHRF